MVSSICLRATIFQNPEGTLWTHYIHPFGGLYKRFSAISDGYISFALNTNNDRFLPHPSYVIIHSRPTISQSQLGYLTAQLRLSRLNVEVE
jgi:hypothetical protein